jgi:4a-hydroxytetrahydrobiopterin dehydratase
MAALAEGRIIDGAPALAEGDLRAGLAGLPGWQLAPDRRSIRREWHFRSFKAAAQLANLAASSVPT